MGMGSACTWGVVAPSGVRAPLGVLVPEPGVSWQRSPCLSPSRSRCQSLQGGPARYPPLAVGLRSGRRVGHRADV